MHLISKYTIPFLLLVIYLFSSCEEPTDWELLPETNGKLVVEAILTNELRFQEVRLSQSFNGLNGQTPHVTDAIVSVSANGLTVNFPPDSTTPGLYLSEIPFSIVDDLVYQLDIEWQGEQYTALSEMAEVAPIPLVTYRPYDGTDNLLILNDFVPLYNPNQQAMYEVDIIWSHLTGDSTSFAKLFYYTFKEVDVNELVRPDREDVPFPRGSILVVRKFGLNDEFADYLYALAAETDWNSGIFYSNPSSLPTNISNGGLGFFSTCPVLTQIKVAL